MGQDKNLRGRSRGRGRGRGRPGALVADQTVNIIPKYNIPTQRQPLLDLAPAISTPNVTPRVQQRRRNPGTTTSSSYTRAQTSGSGTPGTGANDKFVIIAITGGRGDARGEIGLAAMDAQYPHMILCQMSDNNSYINTLTKINMLQPVEILLPYTMGSRDPNPKGIYHIIKSTFKHITITEVERMHFNATTGFERIQTHCAEQFSSVELVVNSKYYALSAAAALFKYIEFIQHIVYTPKSMRIDYETAENATMIGKNIFKLLF